MGVHKGGVAKALLHRNSYSRTQGAHKPHAHKSVALRGVSGNSGNPPAYASNNQESPSLSISLFGFVVAPSHESASFKF